jgi:hypothetical protein
MVIGLELYVAFRPFLKQLGLIGPESKDGSSGADKLGKALLKIGEIAGWVGSIFARFLSHKSVLIAIGVAAGLVVLPFLLMQAAITIAIGLFVALLAIGAEAVSWLLDLGSKAWEAGTALVDGLINGITGAAGKLLSTVKTLGKDALKEFKSIFKIQSPSRVMMGVGENISLGLAQGIAAGAPAVNDNMTAVVDPIAPPRVNTPATTATSSVSLSGVTIQITITGVQNAADLEERMPEIMANALEQAVQSKGLSPATQAA